MSSEPLHNPEELEERLRQNPFDFALLLQLVETYQALGRPNDALPLLKRYVQNNPSSAEARYQLGLGLEKANDPEEALQVYRMAVVLDEGFTPALEARTRLELSLQEARFNTPTVSLEQMQTKFSGGDALPNLGLIQEYTPSPYAPEGPSNHQNNPLATTALEEARSDRFHLGQAFEEIWQIIIAPRRFFRAQQGKAGFLAPFAIITMFVIIETLRAPVLQIIVNPVDAIAAILSLPFNIVGLVGSSLIGFFFSAFILHIAGWLFGNRSDFSVSFRIATYVHVPWIVFSILSTFLFWGLVNTLKPTLTNVKQLERDLGIILNDTADVKPSAPKPGTPKTKPQPQTFDMQKKQVVEVSKKLFQIIWERSKTMLLIIATYTLATMIWAMFLTIQAISTLQRLSLARAAAVVSIIYLIGFAFAGMIGAGIWFVGTMFFQKISTLIVF